MKSVECLKQNKVDGFEKVRAIKSRRQTPYLQKILTKAEFSQKQVGVFKFPGKRCECCTSLPLCYSCTFKNIDKTFNLRAHFSCNSFNLLYVIICLTCGEKYTGETGVDKTKPRDCVQVYQQHIRQPQYQNLKVEEHLRTCGKGTFETFPLLKMQSSEIDCIGVQKEILWKNIEQN